MTSGERSARGSRSRTKPAAPATKFELPLDVKTGTRSHLRNEELRAGLLHWPAERIADYLISIVGWDLDRRNLELCVIAQLDVAHAVAGLHRQMEIAVDVNEVRWDEVRDFVAGLERVLVAIRSVGLDHPREAVELSQFLLVHVRMLDDAVQGEDELANFFDEVVTIAHELALQAREPPEVWGMKLIDIYVTGCECGMGRPAIDLVKGLTLSAEQRREVAAWAREKLAFVPEHAGRDLEQLAQFLTK